MDKTVLVDPIVAADSAWKSMSAYLNHKPTKEQCKAYSKAHTEKLQIYISIFLNLIGEELD